MNEGPPSPPGNSGEPPITRHLKPREQAGAVMAGSTATLIFIFIVIAVGKASHHEVRVPREFIIADSIVLAIGALALYLLANFFDAIVATVESNTTAKPMEEASSDRAVPKSVIVAVNGDRWANFWLWLLSVSQFLLLGLLAMETGGLATSPFVAILTTFLALGPYVMRGVYSIWVLWLAGTAYLALLGFWQPLLRKPAVEASAGIFWLVDFGTVTIAILVSYLIKNRQHRGNRRSR